MFIDQVDVGALASPLSLMSDSRHLQPAQVRAARALLGWTQSDLAARAGVGKQTVVRFEGGGHAPIGAVLEAIQTALETGGAEFISDGAASIAGGAGVRLSAAPRQKNDNFPESDALVP